MDTQQTDELPSEVFEKLRQLSEEQLRMRFNPKSVTRELILDLFIGHWLLKLLKRRALQIQPTSQEDFITLSGLLPRWLLAMLFDRNRPTEQVTNNDRYIQWLHEWSKDTKIDIDHLNSWVAIGEKIINKWQIRRSQENQMIRGVGLIAIAITILIKGLIYFGIITAIINGSFITAALLLAGYMAARLLFIFFRT